ncbi:teichuronic acid biosynthesis glycosyltransferase TuaG [Alkalibacterium gilvum]|uniref:Teichuronic acid biosynthesis glycosyltransferase TuaG n=1 Tax=Alkalibacterium gilvum TaxID=1130080 RepID=A0A1H6RDW8_9LACT|nr:glycosyltransferase family 2 protein [Alkalibacterium gilvum]SEI54019.1 teichuronic acid biosynthesis glycosyltransferase TuaG [Alkalibacterium gilvum]
MTQTLVTIITPVFDAEKHLNETIKSVLDQTYENFEYLLVDDCSNDDSQNIVKQYSEKDSRVKLIRLSKNSGAAVARNKGLEQAKGSFIAFLDSDDIWYPEKLSKQIDFMHENDYGFTYTKFELINEDGSLKKEASNLPQKLNYYSLLKNTAIACSTVMINKKKIGDFRMPLVRKGQDTATWLKILRDYEYAFLLNETLNQYRAVEGSLSSNKIQALKRTWNTYRNLEQLPLLKAIYYFTFSVVNAVLRRI